MAGSLAFGNWSNCDVYLVFGNLLIYIARETIIITMPANAATLPRPYLGPDRPPSANWWVRGPVLGAGPSFLGFCCCSVSGSPVGIMGQVFFSRAVVHRLVGARTHHRNKSFPHRIYSSQFC